MQEGRALAIAAKLPVLLVEHLSTERPRNASKRKAMAFEYPSIPVDTQDVIAMYRVAHESIERARDGGGPTHMVSVRWEPAATAHSRRVRAGSRDAVKHLEQWLTARGLPAAEWRREVDAVAMGDARPAEEKALRGRISGGVTEGEDTEARSIA